MIAQAVTEPDNKAAHRQPPVLDRHTPFFRRILDRQINNLTRRVIRREHFAFLDGGTDHAVQQFDSIGDGDGDVDGFADIGWINEERIEIFPARTPAFADLRLFIVPYVRELIQRHQCRFLCRSLRHRFQPAGNGFVIHSDDLMLSQTGFTHSDLHFDGISMPEGLQKLMVLL